MDGKGLSSYPHPKLMPDFWQFPTVSMGLGPLMAIYQARFLKYLHARGIANTENRKVWVFCGDGEMDEPESLGAIGLAARENLDNLIFVINCNLQRLDGPVRGNGKIIQELEGDFRGAGWNVIKLLWGNGWDELLASDKTGKLKQLMMETLDGDYQTIQGQRRCLCAQALLRQVPRDRQAGRAHDRRATSWSLRRGGHDPQKVYAAFHARQRAQGPAHRAAGQDRQGLRHGQGRRRPRTPSTRPRSWRTRTSMLHPRPLQHPGPGQPAGQPSVLQAGGRHAPRCSTCTSAARPWAATCRSAAPGR